MGKKTPRSLNRAIRNNNAEKRLTAKRLPVYARYKLGTAHG